MDDALILEKTSKGSEEIESRTYKLSPALRMVLILVDGVSDVAALKTKATGVTALDDYLEELLRQGFIQRRQEGALVGGNRESRPEATGEMASGTRVKWELVDMIRNIIGDEFGVRATERFLLVDDTPEALNEALDGCYQYILLTIDEKKAEAVKTRGQDILSREGF